ncbi:MAG TPA: DUF1003 domain-containing protein [Solirubrobacteraceae bacterium]
MPSEPPAPAAPTPDARLIADRHRPFGGDTFGIQAERFARFFGTPAFILSQTLLVVLWIVLNALAITKAIAWDRYPFIALNLAFSLQAAYAAPLILLAQTRQADRDKVRDGSFEAHREETEARQTTLLTLDKELAERHTRMLEQNTELTRRVTELTTELHEAICQKGKPGGA